MSFVALYQMNTRLIAPHRHRFANVDFALVSGLQRWMKLLMHVFGYDLQCQHRPNFDERMSILRSVLEELDTVLKLEGDFPTTVGGVGKFHLAGHKALCAHLWSFNLLPGSAMTDGEAAERIWSAVNPLGNRTREMNPGHRHDVMNEFYSDQNVRRVHGMGKWYTGYHRDQRDDDVRQPRR